MVVVDLPLMVAVGFHNDSNIAFTFKVMEMFHKGEIYLKEVYCGNFRYIEIK
ncbi:hypothetical protein E1A91_D08G223300v1 [Gossypium mustelinum]|uniref:Uncharacterized protein n=1 Tax=Gossypium mustelinum TaxID=34275 RepID=A0A5D2U0A6_GOSMU|nr:hypothetical protein E1A91_D08G223300v1 [Gossypium mustelinum]